MSLKDALQKELTRLKNSRTITPTDLKALGDMIDMLPDDINAARQDARAKYSPGDVETAVVEDPGEGTRHGDPLARLADGLVVFLCDGADILADVQQGDQIPVRLSTVRSRYARGVPIARRIDPDQAEPVAVSTTDG